jgi:hypothetical protein
MSAAVVADARTDQGRLRRVAAVVAVVSLLLTAGAAAVALPSLVVGPPTNAAPGDVEQILSVVIVAVAFPLLGWAILRRMADHRLGWIYLAIAAFEGLNLFSSAYSAWAYTTAGGRLPLAAELSWVSVWAWRPGWTLFSTLGILLFPDGHLPSRRWWPVVAITAIGFVMLLVPTALATWPYRGAPLMDLDPAAQAALAAGDPLVQLSFLTNGVSQMILLAATLGSIAGLLARWRRARGVERAQLKWFGYGAVLTVAVLVASFAGTPGMIAAVIFGVLMGLALPLTVALAILRYRLWDIDRLISRTLSYAIVTGLLAAVFAGLVLALQAALAAVTGAGGTLAIAASTLAVFALFQPLRRRVQRQVDRRFNRSRVDAEAALAGLVGQLHDETDLERVGDTIQDVVQRALAPSRLALWTRDR